MNDPFLFDELADDVVVETEPEAPDYRSPIERALLDIMEEVDTLFRANVTVDQYDDAQRRVKKILTEAFCEKKPNPCGHSGRALLLVRDGVENC